MFSNDLVNAIFELLGSMFILNHCLTLYSDKVVKGVSVISTIYFFSWGLWNLHFYPALNQPLSFGGGIAITTANVLWISMMLYYKYVYHPIDYSFNHQRCAHCDLKLSKKDMVLILDNDIVHSTVGCSWGLSKSTGKKYRNITSQSYASALKELYKK